MPRRRRARRPSAAAALVAALLAAPPPAAAQEADTDIGPSLVPAPELQLPQPGGFTREGQVRTGRFRCQNVHGAWSYIANVPSGYVIGNCREGWYLHRTRFYDGAGFNWDGGFVTGGFDGCGWMRADFNDLRDADKTYSGCAGPSRLPSDFMHDVNCLSPCGDGTPTRTIADCPQYANLRPWSSAPAPTDVVRTVKRGRVVRWRYRSRDREWVMVHDVDQRAATGPRSGKGNGNWVFMHRTCLPDPLPGAHHPPPA